MGLYYLIPCIGGQDMNQSRAVLASSCWVYLHGGSPENLKPPNLETALKP